METTLGAQKPLLCDGPALKEGGFFYEMYLPGGGALSESDFSGVTKAFKRIVRANETFVRKEVSREVAAEAFKYNQFKLDMLQKVPGTTSIATFRVYFLCVPLSARLILRFWRH